MTGLKPMPVTLPSRAGATSYPTTLVALELKAYHGVIYVIHVCALILMDN